MFFQLVCLVVMCLANEAEHPDSTKVKLGGRPRCPGSWWVARIV